MNISVTRSQSPSIDLLPIVSEAVDALGYFQPGAKIDLARLFIHAWPAGKSAAMLLKPDIEIDHLLSMKGSADRIKAIRNTTLRIMGNINRAQFDLQEPEWSQFSSRVCFAGRGEDVCEKARKRNGKTRARRGRPSLPLEGCTSECCMCRWDYEPGS